jgi:hypothetical protein
MAEFLTWFVALPHPAKVFVAGNHDNCFEGTKGEDLARHLTVYHPNITYLCDEGAIVGNPPTTGGLRFYGSPHRPVQDDHMRRTKEHWAAFKLPEVWAEHVWKTIPTGLDVLVTHMPPAGILDFADDRHKGSPALLAAVQRAAPRYHIFGHVHDCPGMVTVGPTTFVNATVCGPDDKLHLAEAGGMCRVLDV